MSATAELSATEVATRLLPLLKEYAAKMAALSERAAYILAEWAQKSQVPVFAVEIGRLACLHDALDKPVTDLAREASGLIEHGALEYHLRNELKLRADELEEHVRFAQIMVDQLTALLKPNKAQAERVRELIEKSGRYKAPF